MTKKTPLHIFGILNITPDSFSDGGKFFEAPHALEQAKKLIQDGAHILDIGAESTRPGASPITPDQEWIRLKNIIPHLLTFLPQRISLDTKNPSTAAHFLELGGTIINDVSGCQSPHMQDLIARHDATVVINHFPGQTTAEVHTKAIDSINQVEDDLLLRRQELITRGVQPHKIILDPGIGFGKTMPLNWDLLAFPARVPDIPVLIGHSKKRFLGEHRYEQETNVTAAQKAIAAGAQYLRVHDPFWYNHLKQEK